MQQHAQSLINPNHQLLKQCQMSLPQRRHWMKPCLLIYIPTPRGTHYQWGADFKLINPLHFLGGESSHIPNDVSSPENNSHTFEYNSVRSPVHRLPKLNILYYNARSLVLNLDNNIWRLTPLCINIICIVETWLGDCIMDGKVLIPRYYLIRHDRNRHGGGVAICVLDTFSFSVTAIGPNSLELISISINHPSTKIGLAVLYGPPTSPSSFFDSLFSTFEYSNVL